MTRVLRDASGARFATAARSALEALSSLEATAYKLGHERAQDIALRAHVSVFGAVYSPPRIPRTGDC